LATLSFRLNPSHSTSSNLQKINDVLKKYNPDYPASIVFVDEDYRLKFSGSVSLGKLALLFAILSIAICCLGLYSLAVYMVNTRVKEIGIRKVLGASVVSLASLLSKDFIRLVLIAFVIASPVAWWILQSWLQGFTYRISISWWIFLATGFISVMIAMVTIGFRVVRSSLANPVKNLRTE
jgi:ABC-type antimicrobial peptide transport system permease subunit